MVDGEHLPGLFMLYYDQDVWFRNVENYRAFQRLMDRWVDDERIEREFGFLFAVEATESSVWGALWVYDALVGKE